MFKESIAEYKRVLQIAMQWPVAFAALGNVYGLSGDKKGAKNISDTLNLLSAKRFVTSYGVALVYAALNEKDQAFQWLNKAYDERSHWLVWLNEIHAGTTSGLIKDLLPSSTTLDCPNKFLF